MTTDDCLASPHHFTHLGTCYVGDVAFIQISSPQAPKPATFWVHDVPEPGAISLAVVAIVAALLFNVRPRWRSR
jgi:hypothetical protein